MGVFLEGASLLPTNYVSNDETCQCDCSGRGDNTETGIGVSRKRGLDGNIYPAPKKSALVSNQLLLLTPDDEIEESSIADTASEDGDITCWPEPTVGAVITTQASIHSLAELLAQFMEESDESTGGSGSETDSSVDSEQEDDSTDNQPLPGNNLLMTQLSTFVAHIPVIDADDLAALLATHLFLQDPTEDNIPENFVPVIEIDTPEGVLAGTTDNGTFIVAISFSEESSQNTVAFLITTHGAHVLVVMICDNSCHEGGCKLMFLSGKRRCLEEAMGGLVHQFGGCTLSFYKKQNEKEGTSGLVPKPKY